MKYIPMVALAMAFLSYPAYKTTCEKQGYTGVQLEQCIYTFSQNSGHIVH